MAMKLQHASNPFLTGTRPTAARTISAIGKAVSDSRLLRYLIAL